MMEHPEYRDESRVIHMHTYLSRLMALVPTLSLSTFVDGDAGTERALYNLTILGEAANRISREYAALHAEVDFRDMAGLRHKLIHDYANIRLDVIWTILHEDVPKWSASIAELRASLPPDPPLPENLSEFL